MSNHRKDNLIVEYGLIAALIAVAIIAALQGLWAPKITGNNAIEHTNAAGK